MANMESMIEADHFIMLDVLDTVSRKEYDRDYPCVQIIYPSNENSYLDNKVTESHPENGLLNKKREKQLFTITLNAVSDYQAEQLDR